MRQEHNWAKAAVAHHLFKGMLKEPVDPCIELRRKSDLEQRRQRVDQPAKHEGQQQLPKSFLIRQKLPRQQERHQHQHLPDQERANIADRQPRQGIDREKDWLQPPEALEQNRITIGQHGGDRREHEPHQQQRSHS